jgi:hypothetical protein
MLSETDVFNIINNNNSTNYLKLNKVFFSPLRHKINYLLKDLKFENVSFMLGLHYLKKVNSIYPISRRHIADFCITCIIIANKYLDDNFYDLKDVCDKCDLNINTYLENEQFILKALDWNLMKLDEHFLNTINKTTLFKN